MCKGEGTMCRLALLFIKETLTYNVLRKRSKLREERG